MIFDATNLFERDMDIILDIYPYICDKYFIMAMKYIHPKDYECLRFDIDYINSMRLWLKGKGLYKQECGDCLHYNDDTKRCGSTNKLIHDESNKPPQFCPERKIAFGRYGIKAKSYKKGVERIAHFNERFGDGNTATNVSCIR